jgi:thermitase
MMLLTFALMIAGALGTAQARAARPRARGERSRGVIILPGAGAPSGLRMGDTPTLAGQRVSVKMTDPEVGLLVSSATLPDDELARALEGAGVDAEVNEPRYILPVTPTAELFHTPHATRLDDLPNKPSFWHVEQIGADLVHHTGITGTADLIVGVIDTGVYTSHPLLAGSVLPGYDFVYGDAEPEDLVGHGTHVAGIVHSICPRCSLLPVKVLDYYGGDDYTIARGIRYAAQRGARVIQISLGGPAPSTTMCQAVRAVEQAGAQVVIAAGNSAGSSAEFIGYPGLCSPDSLVISATDRNDIPAWFSNYGPSVDLAAPGSQVWSTIPPSEFYEDNLIPASGTSMAAPQVSGAAGLLWSANPAWTAAQIRDRLVATARDISTLPGIDDVYGPRVDVAQAFGLRSRPVVVGLTVDKPWLPREGSDAERTIQVSAVVRGEAVGAVRLGVTIGGATQQLTMTLQGGDLYGVSYTVPRNTASQRDILVRPSAQNSAGTMYGGEEIVAQDGDPLQPPTIRLVNGPARVGSEVKFMVEWDGTWNNFDFDCGSYSENSISFYNPRGQPVTCTYTFPGTYFVAAHLYYQNISKTGASAEIGVTLRYAIYVPVYSVAGPE